MSTPIRTMIKFNSTTYKDAKNGSLKDRIIRDGSFIIVTDIPWWGRCFGLLSSRRIVIGDGKTPLKKLKFS